jgi:hypothetical protein
VLRDLLLPLVFRFVVTDRSLAWICDHHLDWDAPGHRRGDDSRASGWSVSVGRQTERRGNRRRHGGLEEQP